MRLATVLAAFTLATAFASSAHAQTCTGAATFNVNPVRIGAGFQTTDHAKSYGVNLGFGSPSGPFASGTVSRAEYDGVSGSGTIFSAQAGYALDLNPTRTAQLCPLAGFDYQSGPDIDTGLGTASASAHAFGFGGSIGVSVPASPNLDIVPFGGAMYTLARATATFGGVSDTESQNYTDLTAGAGFVINKVVTIRPAVSYPAGVDGAKATFQLGVALNFGGSSARR